MESFNNRQPPKLLDQVRSEMRAKHYSLKTEKTYLSWIKQYIFYNSKRHPKDMGDEEINTFLKYLAVERKVSSSTQNQALCAIVYLYKHILKKDVGKLELIWAQKSKIQPISTLVGSTSSRRILVSLANLSSS